MQFHMSWCHHAKFHMSWCHHAKVVPHVLVSLCQCSSICPGVTMPRRCHTSWCHCANAVPYVLVSPCQAGATRPGVTVPRQRQVRVPWCCSTSWDRGAVPVLLCQDWGRSDGVASQGWVGVPERCRGSRAAAVPGFGCHGGATVTPHVP
ncbi:hypothetical protein DV515_00018481, partial [Chloebia gouldiae]